MRAGRFWVLLVLAALFSMHGLQSMAADSSHAGTAAVHLQGPASLAAAAAAPTTLVVSDADADRPVGMGVAGSVDDGREPPAPDMAHVWAAACLAVLATGLAVVAVWWMSRRGSTSSPRDGAFHRLRPWSARTHPLRPPDLAALCLLRI